MSKHRSRESLWLEVARRISVQKPAPLVEVILQHRFPVASKQEIIAAHFFGQQIPGPDYPPKLEGEWVQEYNRRTSNDDFETIERMGLIAHLPHQGRRPHVIKVNPELRYDRIKSDLDLIESGFEDMALFTPPDREEWEGEPSRAEQPTVNAVRNAAEQAATAMKHYVGLESQRGELPGLGRGEDDANTDKQYGDGIPDFGLEVLMYGRIAIFLDTVEDPRVEYNNFTMSSDQILISGRLTAAELSFKPRSALAEDNLDIDVPTEERIKSAVRETLVTFLADSYYRPEETESLEDVVRHFEPDDLEERDQEAEERKYDPGTLKDLAEGAEYDLLSLNLAKNEYKWAKLVQADIDVEPVESENQVRFQLVLSGPPS